MKRSFALVWRCHSGASLAHGTASCWGSNFSGELGDGTTDNSAVPVTVAGLL